MEGGTCKSQNSTPIQVELKEEKEQVIQGGDSSKLYINQKKKRDYFHHYQGKSQNHG